MNALYAAERGMSAPAPGPPLNHPAGMARLQLLMQLLQRGWIGLVRERIGPPRCRLPLLWDCDVLLGDRSAGQTERHVLCGINARSVSPFLPSAIKPPVAAVKARFAAPQR